MGHNGDGATVSTDQQTTRPSTIPDVNRARATAKTTRQIFLLSLILLALVGLLYPPAGPIDDTFITFRYAENLAHGRGLVFNPGERVEGYTSFGQLLLTAPAALIGKGAMRLWATLLGLVAWAGVVALAWRQIARQRGEAALGRADWFVIIYLSLCAPAVVWAWSGMEAPAVALAWVAAWVFHLREREDNAVPWRSGLATFAAGLLHPEGAPFVGVVLAASWLWPWRKRSLKNAAAYLLVAWGLFGLYWLWRWQYFGDLMPNTYYAKVGSHLPVRAGLVYVFKSAASALVPLYLLVLLWRDRARWREWPRPLVTALGLLAAVVGYCVLVGGDYFAFQRFLLPAFPFTVVAVWIMLHRRETKTAPSPHPARWAALVAAALFVWANLVPSMQVLEQLAFRSAIWPSIVAGQAFRRDVPRNALVATLPIGAFGLYAERKILDMMGLTDRHIAHVEAATGKRAAGHEKSDYAYVLARRPDIIVQLPTLFPGDQAGLQSWLRRSTFAEQQAEIYEQPAFAQNYRLAWLFATRQPSRRFGPQRRLEPVGVYAFLRNDLVNTPAYRKWRTFDDAVSQYPFLHWREYRAANQRLIGRFSLGMWNF